MTRVLLLLAGIVFGAGLVGSYLLGRARGRMHAFDDIARMFGWRIFRGEASAPADDAPEADLALIGEAETNADGTPRQTIIARLSAGEDVDLRRSGDTINVASRFGLIGRLQPQDAVNIGGYLDKGGRVAASIAHIGGAADTAEGLSVVVNVVGVRRR